MSHMFRSTNLIKKKIKTKPGKNSKASRDKQHPSIQEAKLNSGSQIDSDL